MADTPPATPPRRNYGWIGFFVFIILGSIGATSLMIWYNLSIQLTPEQLDEARELWRANGPKNYDMVYTKQINDDAKPLTFAVKVRDGNVKEVKLNNKKLEANEEQEKVKEDPRIYHTMDQLLRDVQRFMDIDQKAGAKRVYATAIFDPDSGALRRYVRRVARSTERVEIQVKLTPVSP